MLGWEQKYAGQKLHAYEGHALFPVCGDEGARRFPDDKFPRTTYSGPMPPPPELICETCRTWERDRDPMFIEGRRFERARIVAALGREANRIFQRPARLSS